MKLMVLIFCILLPACSFYTITNKTNEDMVIKKSGGDTFVLKAFSCVELSEYFLGLGGDFPFALTGYDREYSANHYEIIRKVADSANEVAADNVVLSNENTECDKKTLQKIKIDDKLTPVCGDDADAKVAECDSSDDSIAAAKCQVEEGEKKPICVNRKNELLNTAPKCETEDVEPICKEKEVKTQTVEYYTITLKASAIVTISLGNITEILNTVGSCVKIKRDQFSSLVISTASASPSPSVPVNMCANPCTPGNYEVAKKDTGTEFVLNPVRMNTSPSCKPFHLNN